MGYHDAQQVCMKGHQMTDNYYGHPEFRRPFCSRCGAETIHQCPKCRSDIKGDYHVEGVIDWSPTPVPEFCENCGSPFPWAGKIKPVSTIIKSPSDNRVGAPAHVHAASPLLRLMAILGGLLGAILLVGGIYLAIAQHFADTKFNLFGNQFSSTSVGVSMAFIGAVLVIMTFRRIVRAIERLAALPK